MAAPLPNSTIRNHVIPGPQLVFLDIDLSELRGIFKCAVLLVDGASPWNAQRTWNVAAAQCTFVWIVRHVQPFAAEFFGATDVHQRKFLLYVLEHLVAERAELPLVPLSSFVPRGGILGNFSRKRAFLLKPLQAPAIHDFGSCMSKELHNPERIRRPPVILVTVKHDGGIA